MASSSSLSSSSSSSSPEAREIRALSLCLTVVAFALALQLETFDEVEQVRLKLAGMLLASCWAGPLTIVSGFYAYPSSWKLLQPFQGGGGFVVVQAVGWLLYGISLFATAVACLNARQLATAALPRGIYASLGSLAAASQATLNFSVGLFEEEPPEVADTKKNATTLQDDDDDDDGVSSRGGPWVRGGGGSLATRGSRSERSKKKAPLTALSAMLAVAGMVLTASGDEAFRGVACARLSGGANPATEDRCLTFGAAAAGALVWTGAASHGLASVLTHVVHGRVAHGSHHYKAFMPFEGGARFVLLQALAWTLWGLVVDVLVAVSARKVAKIPGGPTALGLCLFVANVVLVLSLDLFHPLGDDDDDDEIDDENDDDAHHHHHRLRMRRKKDKDNDDKGDEERDAKTRRSHFFLVGGPERVVAALFVVLSLAAFLVGMKMTMYLKRRSRAPPPAYAMATVLCHLAPPLAHVGGARTEPGYSLVMVGDGGPRFVVAQATGWMLYAFSLLSSVVLVVNGAHRFHALVRGAAPLAVLSSGLLVASVGLFDRSRSRDTDVDAYAARDDDGFTHLRRRRRHHLQGSGRVPATTTHTRTSSSSSSTSPRRPGFTAPGDFDRPASSRTRAPGHHRPRGDFPTDLENLDDDDDDVKSAATTTTTAVWRVSCDPAALAPRPALLGSRRRRRLRRSLLASNALAASLAARDALLEIAQLRSAAKTAAVRSLLEAAEDALSSSDAARTAPPSSSDDEDDDDDDLDELIGSDGEEGTHGLRRREEEVVEAPALPLPSAAEVAPTKRLVLARVLDNPGPFASRHRLLQFLGDAASLFAAPLASLLGIALFAGADFFRPGPVPLSASDRVVVDAALSLAALSSPSKRGRYVLSPLLAFCAFVATLASAPLQFHLERRFPPMAAPGKRRRFVALRLVALAAWSFAVLVALAALLRYTACNGCALALSIGRRWVSNCGWGGLVVQLLVLVCAPPADSLQTAFGLIGRRRQKHHRRDGLVAPGERKKQPLQQPTTTTTTKTAAVGAKFPAAAQQKKKQHQNTDTTQGPPERKAAAFEEEGLVLGRWRQDDDGLLMGATMPEDAWRQVEAFLAFADLCVLSAAAKKPRWCAAYTRAARWRRLFAARGCGSAHPAARAPKTTTTNHRYLLEAATHTRTSRRGAFPWRDAADAAVDGARWFWQSLDAALAGEQEVIDAHFDGPPRGAAARQQHHHLAGGGGERVARVVVGDPLVGADPHLVVGDAQELRDRAYRALRRGVDRRRELRRRGRAALAARSRALPWKLACVLHERGAPLVRCVSCGEVDLGDDREFLAPCRSCGTASYHHRRCLERDLDLCILSSSTGDDDVPYGTVDDGLLENLLRRWRAQRATLRCAACGGTLALGARPPRGPVELGALLWRDRSNVFRVGRRCLQQWTLALLLVTAIARRHAKRSFSCAPSGVNAVMAWYLLQQTCLFEVFVTHRFSAVVARLWSTATRNAVGFYLRLYFYFIFASVGILATFSPLPFLLSEEEQQQQGPNAAAAASEATDTTSLPRQVVLAAIAAIAWTNVIVYFFVSSSCLYIFVKTHYRLPTVADHRP